MGTPSKKRKICTKMRLRRRLRYKEKARREGARLFKSSLFQNRIAGNVQS